MPRLPGLDTAGLVVLILAGALAVALVVAFVDIAVRGFTLSSEGIDLVSTLVGAIIGVIGTFIGMRAAERRDKPDL